MVCFGCIGSSLVAWNVPVWGKLVRVTIAAGSGQHPRVANPCVLPPAPCPVPRAYSPSRPPSLRISFLLGLPSLSFCQPVSLFPSVSAGQSLWTISYAAAFVVAQLSVCGEPKHWPMRRDVSSFESSTLGSNRSSGGSSGSDSVLLRGCVLRLLVVHVGGS